VYGLDLKREGNLF